MKKRGRPPLTNRENLPAYLSNKLPKKENERHRQMRAYYLSLPEQNRTLQAVVERFNVSWDTVQKASVAFHWAEDAQKRDASITDPFFEKHNQIIEGFRTNALLIACKHLENEALRTGIPGVHIPVSVSEKINNGNLEGAHKELSEFIKFLPMKAKDYKDLINLIDLVRKIVFEWDPNKVQQKQPVNMPITGGKNFIMVNNPYAPKTGDQKPFNPNE